MGQKEIQNVQPQATAKGFMLKESLVKRLEPLGEDFCSVLEQWEMYPQGKTLPRLSFQLEKGESINCFNIQKL